MSKITTCTCRIVPVDEPGVDELTIKKCPLCKAAPELLTALKALVRRFEGCLMTNGTEKEFARESTVHERAAIAKAEGQ